MAEKEVSPGGINTEKINGGQETPVIENNPPREQLKIGSKFVSDEDSNRETDVDGDLVVGKDLYVDGKMKIGGEIIEGDLEVEGTLEVNEKVDTPYLEVDDVHAKTGGEVVVHDNLQVGTSENNKDLIVYGKIGQAIAQNDFIENKHAHVTISEFSAYKLGQFVYVEFKCTSSNYNASDKIFDVKSAYRPKLPQSSNEVHFFSDWGGVGLLAINGLFVNKASTTGSGYFYAHFLYEVA